MKLFARYKLIALSSMAHENLYGLRYSSLDEAG